jgi:hypothetical protein
LPNDTPAWRCVLALDELRRPIAGSAEALRAAIGRGADLRIASEFRHNEHIDTSSPDDELVRESMDMRETWLVDGRWAAGIVTLRQPIALPEGFGPRASMSFFLYNEDGGQAIARPHLDGPPAAGPVGPFPLGDHRQMPRYHESDQWDADTNAPSSNFVYDFDVYRFFVRDDWTEALHHRADGEVVSGSIDELARAFGAGAEIKVGIRGLAADLPDSEGQAAQGPEHEVFIQAGACYYYTRRKLFLAGSHPIVRVRPAVPLVYRSRGWDFGWLLLRSDGHVARLLYDPYTLGHARSTARHELRWFYR